MIAPRIHYVPDAVSSLADETISLGESCGIYLDEWQQVCLRSGMGLRKDGKWSAFEVGVNVSRQNGKNEIALVRELGGLFLLREQLIVHSAHEFKTATEHQLRIEDVIKNDPSLHKRIKPRGGYRHSNGSESINLRSGQRIRFFTRTKSAGRGHTGDLVVCDEAMMFAMVIHGVLLPMLSARSVLGNPQLWYFGTAVDQLTNENGLVFTKLRNRALAGTDPRLAWVEWSIDAENPDAVTPEMAADERNWELANPAIDVRISREFIAMEQRSLPHRQFVVERLTGGDYPDEESEGPIEFQKWVDLADADSAIDGTVAFAFDIAPDRASAAIAVAGRRADGLHHVEIIEHARGTGWVVPLLEELVGQSPSGIVCDATGPAASLLPALEDIGIEVTTVSSREHGQACGIIFDEVAQGTLRHLGTPELALAVRGAARRPLGDAWAWKRNGSSVDISPLVACTLALWQAATADTYKEPWIAWR